MRILAISTWFPYPLSQGSKIRAYYLLQALGRRHDVALASFADPPPTAASLEQMRRIVREVHVAHDNPFTPKPMRSFAAWLSRTPRAARNAYSEQMAQLVSDLARRLAPDCVIAFTLFAAPYALAVPDVKRMVDIDTFVTSQLQRKYETSILSTLDRIRLRLAIAKCRRYEQLVYQQFDLCLATCERERRAAVDLLRLQSRRIGIVANGVDLSAARDVRGPALADSMVFHGPLTYPANRDAMEFFVRDIFPAIRAEVANARLTITGSTEGVSLGSLSHTDGVTLTGYLDDIRSEVARHAVCVVPLRLGGGTRIKILEAMAIGVPVVSTATGAEGLDLEADRHLLIGDTPRAFAAQVVRLLREPGMSNRLAAEALQFVSNRYDWRNIGDRLCGLVEQYE